LAMFEASCKCNISSMKTLKKWLKASAFAGFGAVFGSRLGPAPGHRRPFHVDPVLTTYSKYSRVYG